MPTAQRLPVPNPNPNASMVSGPGPQFLQIQPNQATSCKCLGPVAGMSPKAQEMFQGSLLLCGWLEIRHSLVILGVKPHIMAHSLQQSSPDSSGSEPPITTSKRLFHKGDEPAELHRSTSEESIDAMFLTA